MQPLCLSEEEQSVAFDKLEVLRKDWRTIDEKERIALQLKLGQNHDKMIRLTDAFLDGSVDRDIYENRKLALLQDTKSVEDKLSHLGTEEDSLPERAKHFLELAKSAWLTFKVGKTDKKRLWLNRFTSNCAATKKNVDVAMVSPFYEVAKRFENLHSAPSRNRTCISSSGGLRSIH